ncbi:MAG: hypothetical protein M1838_002060 [Thelocarpon superellum]|nr:MAG: hypothetical protein M1838_002060 [Thelocarpon superellum]
MKTTTSLSAAVLALAPLIAAMPTGLHARAGPGATASGNTTFLLAARIGVYPTDIYVDGESNVVLNEDRRALPRQVFIWDPTTDVVVLNHTAGEAERQVYVGSGGQWAVTDGTSPPPAGSSTAFKIQPYEDKGPDLELRAYLSSGLPIPGNYMCDSGNNRAPLYSADAEPNCDGASGGGGGLGLLVTEVPIKTT